MWHRRELDEILNVYGHFVATGGWTDYALDGLQGCAVFSIFRRASEMPMYTVVKTPADAQKQGQYKAVSMTGQLPKRGQDLKQVLRVFDKKRFSVVD